MKRFGIAFGIKPFRLHRLYTIRGRREDRVFSKSSSLPDDSNCACIRLSGLTKLQGPGLLRPSTVKLQG